MDEPVREPLDITIDAIHEARSRLEGVIVRTPLLRLGGEGAEDIWIKPEVLQPIGSFKLRGAYNAIAKLLDRTRVDELMTVSAGNMSQAVAWSARELGLRARAVMPSTAPPFKISATRALGATIQLTTREEVMAAMIDGRYDDHPGFIHPFNNPDVFAGNGTAGLEITEDLPDVETVIAPVGGGGLVLGIATALEAVSPSTRVYGVQPEATSALAASFEAGVPQRTQPGETITDGAGAGCVVDAFFPAYQRLLTGCLTVSDDETKAAIYRLATKNKLVAEGAGALAVAAALKIPREERGRTVCVVSGGSINPSLLAEILMGAA